MSTSFETYPVTFQGIGGEEQAVLEPKGPGVGDPLDDEVPWILLWWEGPRVRAPGRLIPGVLSRRLTRGFGMPRSGRPGRRRRSTPWRPRGRLVERKLNYLLSPLLAFLSANQNGTNGRE